MKIRSRIDVITNSSTEVFTCKVTDLEDAMKNRKVFKDSLIKNPTVGTVKSMFDDFLKFKTFEDIEEGFLKHPRWTVFNSIPDIQLRPFKLSPGTVKVLQDFGHSEDEIKAYEASHDAARAGVLRRNPKAAALLGKATREWDHHWSGIPESLLAWMKKNGRDFEYDTL